MGRANASVFPEPVEEMPRMLWPDRAGGMEEICIWVGLVIPSCEEWSELPREFR